MAKVKELWVEQDQQSMAVGEAKAFSIDYTDIGTPAAAGTVTAYDAAGVDKSATVLSGAASLAGAIVTLKLFTPASAQVYRLVNAVTISGNTVFGVIDVRVISATHRNLEALVSSAGFRQDLYYRLNVFPIELPPLRERPTDIPLLVQHFIARFSPITGKHILRVDDSFMTTLQGYHWPGNVRELENLVERAMVLCADGQLTDEDLQFNPAIPAEGTAQITPPPVVEPRPLPGLLQDEEKKGILRAIEASAGNMAAAARLLGMNRSTLYYRLKKHDLLHLLPYKWSRSPDEETP